MIVVYYVYKDSEKALVRVTNIQVHLGYMTEIFRHIFRFHYERDNIWTNWIGSTETS